MTTTFAARSWDPRAAAQPETLTSARGDDLATLASRAESERFFDAAGIAGRNPWKGAADAYALAKAQADERELADAAKRFAHDLKQYREQLVHWLSLRRKCIKFERAVEALGDAREHLIRFRKSGLVPMREAPAFTPFPGRRPPDDDEPYRRAFARSFLDHYCASAGVRVAERDRVELLERVVKVESLFAAEQPPRAELKGATEALERLEAAREGFRDLRTEALRNE